MYIGEVDMSTRAENLSAAWRIVQARNLLTPELTMSSRTRPVPVSENSRAVMRANKSKDTKPERSIRSAVHARGFRYRVHTRPISSFRRTADMVFPASKVAVFVDGCFWHGCPEHYRPAKRNADFWNSKIEANKERDHATDRELDRQGWVVIRVWEHEPVEAAVDRIAEAVVARKARSPANM